MGKMIEKGNSESLNRTGCVLTIISAKKSTLVKGLPSSSGLLCHLEEATLPPDLVCFSPSLSSSTVPTLIADPIGEGQPLPAYM